MSDRGFRDFHRIAKTNPPTLADFLSGAARGRPRPSDPEDLRVWDGVSVYSTAAYARRKRRASPVLGGFIVPLDGSVRIERTRGAGHFTLWADAADLLALVIAVEPA